MNNIASARKPRKHRNMRDMPKWQRFIIRNIYTIVITAVLAAVIAGVVLICVSRSKSREASVFKGTYYIDEYTAYEFNGKREGAMCLGETTRYDFTYKVKDGKITIDFKEDRIADASYSYTEKNGTITLLDGKSQYILKKQ